MVGDNVTRRLAAILVADVAKYTQHMEADTDATVSAWQVARENIVEPAIGAHQGRIVKLTGDGFLAEFPTVQEAVTCAVAMQDVLAENPLDFRMSVHLGDIVDDGHDIHGEGVNIAARIEALADPGGICVSGDVYNQVRNQLDYGFEDLGEHEVKHVSAPLRVYRLLRQPDAALETAEAKQDDRRSLIVAAAAAGLVIVAAAVGLALWQPWSRSVEPARPDRMAFELPEKPSVAVLPFDNLSADPEQDYLADGLAENIITALSRIEEMFVIARTSTFTYKGKSVKVQQVAEEQGVRFVLEGSVQKAADRVRITVQLVDGITGHHVWAEVYDREPKDIFAVQDEIALNVAAALQVELTEGEHARLWRDSTKSFEAWSYLKRGDGLYRRYTREDLAEAARMWAKAAALDPDWPIARVALAWVPVTEIQHGWTEDPEGALVRATELAEKALAMDESIPDSYALLGRIHALKGDYEAALALGDKALALNPNHSMNLAIAADNMTRSGIPEKSIGLIRKAMRRSPFYPPWYPAVLIRGYLMLGRYDELIPLAETFLTRNSGSIAKRVRTDLVFVYTELGRKEEARAQLAELLELHPDHGVGRVKATLTGFRDQPLWRRYFDVLRQAGMPE